MNRPPPLPPNLLPHVLIVDDDSEIRRGLARFLEGQGMRVSQAADGPAMFGCLSAGRFDAVLLDIMLPGEDGLSLCRRMRRDSETPILFMTAVTSETDRIIGLELGADDYICKPFNARELLARLRAVIRRSQSLPPGSQPSAAGPCRFEGWQFDPRKRSLVSPDGAWVDLTAGEFDLLLAFVEHPGAVLSRDQLLDLAKGRASVLFDRSVDMQVMRLRRKIEPDPARPSIIRTVRNGGYLFAAEVERGGLDEGAA